MKRFLMAMLLLVAFLGIRSLSVSAQRSVLHLKLHRDRGYSGFEGKIQGHFSLRVTGPESLSSVEFFIDDVSVGRDEAAPWRLNFVTDDYDLGPHKLYAVGRTASGEMLLSNRLERTFVPASESTKLFISYVLPILLAIFGIPYLLYRRDRNRHPEKYGPYSGIFGGAVCPKCGCPYACHWWGLNFFTKKYDRCPHCGQWSLVQRETAENLRAAAMNCGLSTTDDAFGDLGRKSLISE
jgi:hypothetical protein